MVRDIDEIRSAAGVGASAIMHMADEARQPDRRRSIDEMEATVLCSTDTKCICAGPLKPIPKEDNSSVGEALQMDLHLPPS